MHDQRSEAGKWGIPDEVTLSRHAVSGPPPLWGSSAAKRRLRGLVDVATGRYPAFVFGGGLKGVLPVFHFHQVTPEELDDQLSFLSVNGYRTVTSDCVERVVLRGADPPSGCVALAFDDCWSSLWTVAAPLLRKYDFRAVSASVPLAQAIAWRALENSASRASSSATSGPMM
jgi:hypothetical protein